MKLEADKQFIAAQDSVATILSNYDLKLVAFTPATSGIENTTLLITTDSDDVVIRIYRQNKKPLRDIQLEIDFMNYLRDKSIRVPNVFTTTNGASITTIQYLNKQWHAVVMELIPGTHMTEYNQQIVHELATAHATMHIASSNYMPPNYAPHMPVTVTETVFFPQIDKTSNMNTELLHFLDRVSRHQLVLDEDLPRGLCHLDYDIDNVLVKNDAIAAILDFDDMEYAPFAVCLGYTLWHVLRYGNEHLMKQYLQVYETQRPLTITERTILTKVMLFRHYMISDLKIVNGHTNKDDTVSYEQLESVITGLVL